jgi:peroxiredoxin
MGVRFKKTAVNSAIFFFLAGVAFTFAAEPAKMPEFALPDLEGKEWKSSELLGKACIIDFWATWCATCKESIPNLAALNDKYKSQGLSVVGISVDKGSG